MKPPFPAFLVRTSLLMLLLGLSAGAQVQPAGKTGSAPPTSYKLIAVKVTGSKRFTTEEIAACEVHLDSDSLESSLTAEAEQAIGRSGSTIIAWALAR